MSRDKPYAWIHEQSVDSGTTWFEKASGDYGEAAYSLSTRGYDIEKYHSRKRKGELLPYTPFDQTEYGLFLVPGSYGPVTHPNGNMFRTLAPWYAQGNSGLTIEDLSSVASSHLNEVDTHQMVQAAAAKIYAQGHDSLTFLVELSKITALFKGLGNRLDRLIRETNKRRISYDSRDIRRQASTWLELRYGWRTLWFDIVDAQKAFSQLEDQRKRFSDRVGKTESFSEVTAYSYDDVAQSYQISDVTDVTIGVRGSVTADINPPAFRFNPILTGWEVIRFSFIIDWFVGVGSWLESLSFLAFQSQYVAAGGASVSVVKTRHLSDFSLKTGYTGSAELGGPNWAILTRVTRDPQRIPLRPFANINLDVLKVTDLLAILAKATRGFEGLLRL